MALRSQTRASDATLQKLDQDYPINNKSPQRAICGLWCLSCLMSCLVEFLDNLQAFIDVIQTLQGGNQFFGFL